MGRLLFVFRERNNSANCIRKWAQATARDEPQDRPWQPDYSDPHRFSEYFEGPSGAAGCPQTSSWGGLARNRSGIYDEPRDADRPSERIHEFKRVLKKAGLSPAWRVHDLRHAMAAHWLAAGISPKVVSERLGHSSVAFTLQVYGHVLPNQQAEAAEQVADTLLEGKFINSSSTRASGSPSIS